MNAMLTRRRFLKSSLLWVPAAPAIIRAAVIPSHRHIAIKPLAGGYTANGIVFDGSSYAQRTSAFTSAADTKTWTISFWVKQGGTDSAIQYLLREGGSSFTVTRTAANKYDIESGGTSSAAVSSSTYLASSTWHHVIMAAHAPTAPLLYIDGANDLGTEQHINANCVMTGTSWILGATSGGTSRFTGSMADFWFGLEFIDISVAGNLQKFRSAGGKPVDLGATGTNPTGNQPMMLLSGPAASFLTNKGYGGDFVMGAGSISDDSSGP